MIAGIGGASLGTELLKALRLAGGYKVFGCDVSPTAYGLYQTGFEKTYVVSRHNYESSVLSVCEDACVQFLVPGGEQPMALLSPASNRFLEAGIKIIGNSNDVVHVFSNKETAFQRLSDMGFPTPKTCAVFSSEDVLCVGLPCIIKPATGTGGSTGVFFACTVDEAMVYAHFIRRTNRIPLAQEYINEREGEFTIGVLSLPNRDVVGSIALKRCLDAKLSVSYNARGGVISSGYSQGFIGDFPDFCLQAEKIAKAAGSTGPFNIQGRVRDGLLLPFEINPRFSASTYLRAMAGFNEVDQFVRFCATGEILKRQPLRTGYYLRSFDELYISKKNITK